MGYTLYLPTSVVTGDGLVTKLWPVRHEHKCYGILHRSSLKKKKTQLSLSPIGKFE